MIKTIVIVDDDNIQRKLLQSQLRNEYTIMEAANGEELLDILSKDYSKISAILLDIVMPVMDGFETLKNIRESNNYKDIPVILISIEQDISMKVKGIEYKANGFLTKPISEELLKKTLDNVISFHENTALVQSLSKDKLTGLMSHTLFEEECDELIQSHGPGYFMLSCIDIDRFKVINDQYGIEVGDQVLKHVAECISICYRELGGLACRFTADRFAVLYPATFANTAVITENHKLAKNPACIKHPIQLRIGRYLIQDTKISTIMAYERATVAQESIKDRYDVYIANYDDDMRMRILHEQQIVTEMSAALLNGEFVPFFQPQYNHATGALIGAEALVRWKKGDSFIAPGEFIPIFEKNGFVYEIDKYVWEKTCILLRHWLDEDKSPLPISVNISRIDLYKDDFFETICELIKKYRLPTELLRLEITESAFVDSPEHIVKMVNKLIQQGFTLEIDDFGSGYSSLNTLKDIPASILKLDMKFFSDTTNGVRSGAIIESVVRMAKWLGMAIIAEGVEKQVQADYLKSIGCYYIQGYLYAKPMPVKEYEKIMASSLREKKLSRLRTVATLNNEQFWNPDSLETLIFNSYVGGACIFEQYKGRLEVLRVNNQYLRELGNILSDDVNLATMNPVNYLDENNLFLLNQTITEAITTKEETFCELSIRSTMQEVEYIRYSVRLIASTQERNMLYCVIINMTEQRLAERKLMEAELRERESAQRLKVIMDNVNGGVSAIIIHEDGTSQMIFNNDRYYELYGYTKEQAQEAKLDVMKLIVPEDMKEVMEKIRQLKKDRKPTLINYRIIRGDGREAYLSANSSIMRLSEYGNEVITSVVTDVTEKKALEEQLQAIISNINGGLTVSVIHNGKPEFLIANDQFYKLFGYNTQEEYELENKEKFIRIHPADKEKMIQEFTDIHNDARQYTLEYRIIRRDDQIRYIQNNVSIIKLYGIDEPVRLSISNDVTDIHMARMKAAEEADKLDTILNSVNNGITAVILHGEQVEYIMANDKFFEIHGLDRNYSTNIIEQALDSIYPDDRARVLKAVRSASKKSELTTGEYRIIHPDGKLRWIKASIVVTHITGIEDPIQVTIFTDNTDIVESKKQQIDLLDNLPFGAALYEFDGTDVTSIHINKRYWELVKREPKDYGKSSILGVVYPADLEIIKDEITSAIHQNRNCSVDVRIRYGEEGYAPFHITASTKRKADGNYLIFALYSPITNEIMSIQEMLPVLINTMMEETQEISYIKDKYLHYIYCSLPMLKAIGLDNTREILGKTDEDLFKKELAETFIASDRAVVQQGITVRDRIEKIPFRDGLIHTISTSKVPIKDSIGAIVGVYGIGHEIG